jgi:phosphate transport system permease protein
VLWADHFARWLIVAGGIGTILAVLLVCVFLVSVVAPLFWPPRVSQIAQSSEPSIAPLRLEIDDYHQASLALSPDGVASFRRLADGKTLSESRFLADQKLSAFAGGERSKLAVYGFADGSLRSGSLGFDVETLPIEQLSSELAATPIGESQLVDEGLLTRTAFDQFRRERLSASAGEPLEFRFSTGVRRLDCAEREGGFLVVALADDGHLELIDVSQRINELTDTTEFSIDHAPVDWQVLAADRGAPDFIAISGLGDNLYLAWSDGKLLRFYCADIHHPRFAEQFSLLADPQVRLTALSFAMGRSTLLVGDSQGRVQAWFRVKPFGLETPDRATLTLAHDFPGNGAAVTALAPSRRSRSLAVGDQQGGVRILQLTNERLLAQVNLSPPQPVTALAIAPRDDGLLASGDSGRTVWQLDLGYPQVSFAALFLPQWYEGYERPSYVWQPNSEEPKLSLTPLVFGTFKGTLYAMLLGAPLALCAAVYSSEFLHPAMKTKIKPTIEIMASLPSVVLGFLAGVVLAPFTSDVLPAVLASLFTVPLVCMAAAHLWQLLPQQWTLPLASRRFLLITLTLPFGLHLGVKLGPFVEEALFGGDLHAWLNGAIPNPTGGWTVLLLAPCAAGSLWAFSALSASLRNVSHDWSRAQRAWMEAGKFVAGIAMTIVAAALLARVFTLFGWDPRGSIVGPYVQRNALIVGFIMGFTIIPLIYTIAEDALSTVPDHLRSASLGAGATPWQTAARIIIPTAMSGLFSAVMIGLGRAVGETMVVLMAAGNTPILDWNVFNGFQTLSAMIATERAEAEPGSALYRTLFLAALTLFLLTFVLNTVAELVRLRFRRRSYEL